MRILQNLSFPVKNKLLAAAGVMLLLLSYNLAFKRTLDEVRDYSRLQENSERRNNLAYSPGYLERKEKDLNGVLASYQVDTTRWKNDFWLKVSRIGSRNDCEVIYEPAMEAAGADSVTAILKQQIVITGRYADLLRSLDSVEHLTGCGRIYSVSLVKPGEQGPAEEQKEIRMSLRFAAVAK